jgi:hypothetical protein
VTGVPASFFLTRMVMPISRRTMPVAVRAMSVPAG